MTNFTNAQMKERMYAEQISFFVWLATHILEDGGVRELVSVGVCVPTAQVYLFKPPPPPPRRPNIWSNYAVESRRLASLNWG